MRNHSTIGLQASDGIGSHHDVAALPTTRDVLAAIPGTSPCVKPMRAVQVNATV